MNFAIVTRSVAAVNKNILSMIGPRMVQDPIKAAQAAKRSGRVSLSRAVR